MIDRQNHSTATPQKTSFKTPHFSAVKSLYNHHTTSSYKTANDSSNHSKSQIQNKENEVVKTYETSKKRVQKKLLLLTYMRGGSTHLGELFNMNGDVMYWFEPLAGMYDTMYANIHHPIDYVFTREHDLRYLPQKEEDIIFETLDYVLSCQPDKLLIGALSNPFLKFGKMRAFTNYTACVLAEEGTFYNHIQNKKQLIEALVQNQRPHGAPLSIYCDQLTNSHCSNPVSLDPDSAQQCIQMIDPEQSRNQAFGLRQRCLQWSKMGYFRCSEYLQNECSERNIQVTKIIRWNMHTIIKYLDKNPDVKAIMYVRDPRGIINSRISVNFLSKLSKSNPQIETVLLCKKMLLDFKVATEFIKRSSNRLKILRYEDMASKNVSLVKDIYSFIDEKIPREVLLYYEQSLNAAANDGGLFGTRRTDSKATVNQWKRKLKEEQQQFITDECYEVLEKYHYL